MPKTNTPSWFEKLIAGIRTSLRRTLRVDEDVIATDFSFQMCTAMIDGLRADLDGLTRAHGILRADHEALREEVRYYAEHNDTLRFTAKKYQRVLEVKRREQEEVAKREFVKQP